MTPEGKYILRWTAEDGRATQGNLLVDSSERAIHCDAQWIPHAWASWLRLDCVLAHGGTIEPVPLNRQARRDKFRSWDDCGPVSFAEAALMLAKFYNEDEISIEVRDEAEPDDVRTIVVRRVVTFECVNLRGETA